MEDELESGAPSPAQSEMSHGSGIPIDGSVLLQDDSSNEALVVDCDSPGGSSTTPGRWLVSVPLEDNGVIVHVDDGSSSE